MSCTFWNMRRRLRQQLGIERAVAEEKIVADIATAQAAEKAVTTDDNKRTGRKSKAGNSAD